MKKQSNFIPSVAPLKDLNLTSRFLFDEVMDDVQAHEDALSIILGREVSLLGQSQTEKELRVSEVCIHIYSNVQRSSRI